MVLVDGTVKKEGFSLIELVIAITILGILAVIIGPRLMRWIGRASETKAQQELLVLKGSIVEYYAEVRQYPKTLIDLIRKPSASDIALKWHGPYVEPEQANISGNNIMDPWDQPYQYRVTRGGKHQFELYSLGNPEEPKKIDVWEIR